MLTTTSKTDTAALMTALRRLRDPERTPSRPFTPRPHTDIEYYAPCLERRDDADASRKRKLTPAQVREIRVHYATGKASQRRLASLYNVSRPTISRIVTGLSYREVAA